MAEDEKDEKLILFKFHATASAELTQGGKIEIILDPLTEVEEEWKERDASRLRMMLNAYFPEPTIEVLEGMLLEQMPSKRLTRDLERRLGA